MSGSDLAELPGWVLEQWALEDAAERIDDGASFEAEVDALVSGSLDEAFQQALTLSPADWAPGLVLLLKGLARPITVGGC